MEEPFTFRDSTTAALDNHIQVEVAACTAEEACQAIAYTSFTTTEACQAVACKVKQAYPVTASSLVGLGIAFRAFMVTPYHMGGHRVAPSDKATVACLVVASSFLP